MKVVGIIIIVLGLLLTIFTGVSFRTEETVVEVGEFELTREEEHEVNFYPWIGVAAMVVGGVIVFAGRKK
ncbi:MAG: hypothetical protein EA361_14670 [Bacteroidetes bacterium]|nr:MAG: hypothetical protein EA361_14670 [Bacteroidota bacterium]